MDINLSSANLQGSLGQAQGQAQASQLQQLQGQFAHPSSADAKKLKKAAQEFESIFVQQMLDQMDKTIDRKDSLLSGGNAEDYWRGMLNQQVAQSMCMRPGGSGFGLAESIYKQMARNFKADPMAVKPSGPTLGVSGSNGASGTGGMTSEVSGNAN